MPKFPQPQPLFDIITHVNQSDYSANQILAFPDDFTSAHDFLKQYAGNKSTFESYRREIERIIQWSWLIAEKSIFTLKRQDMENYINFCLKPPKSWISLKRVPRFIDRAGVSLPNPRWRPFVATVNKEEHKRGINPDKNHYHLSQKSLQEIFTVLGSFYNYLALEEKVALNPVALIRQKSKYLQNHQGQSPVMRLSERQWQYCIRAAKEMAAVDPKKHERTLFMLSALYLLYLRISELVANARWQPTMNHFYQDANEQWWFKTVGKGNKLRNIAVSDDMLEVLKRYRSYLGLSPFPSLNEAIPLLPKENGRGMTSTRHIRSIIQSCFDNAVIKLRKDNFMQEADGLESATVHWLRHTGISDDINNRKRPIAHVRDDAGHGNISTTDRYNDIELTERYRSAKDKKINQQEFEKK